MYALEVTAVIDAPQAEVWSTWSDMESYPRWDPREQELRLDGPFAAGTTGFSKQVGPRPGSAMRVTLVEAPTRFVCESPLPGGRLVIDHRIEADDAGRTRVTKRYEAHGPMSVAFRLVFARGIRAQMPGTFAALAAEIARRAAASA